MLTGQDLLFEFSSFVLHLPPFRVAAPGFFSIRQSLFDYPQFCLDFRAIDENIRKVEIQFGDVLAADTAGNAFTMANKVGFGEGYLLFGCQDGIGTNVSPISLCQ